jgi:hypothetical protein
MTGERPDRGDGKPVVALLRELAGLVVAYLRQETVVPIKALGRFVAFGVAGAVLLAVGGVLATLTSVRVIQTETGSHLHGDLTWLPYAGGALLAALGAGWAASRIFKYEK